MRHLSATQDNAGPSPAGSFHGLVVQRENPRLAPERPGFESRRVHFLFSFGSVAQLEESTRLRAVGSQVRVLPGPLRFCPCSSVEQSARLRPVRPQVRILPRALQASVAQWMKSGRVLSARSQVRVLPGAQLHSLIAEWGRAPHRVSYARVPGFDSLLRNFSCTPSQLETASVPHTDFAGFDPQGVHFQAGVAQLVEAPDRESGG